MVLHHLPLANVPGGSPRQEEKDRKGGQRLWNVFEADQNIDPGNMLMLPDFAFIGNEGLGLTNGHSQKNGSAIAFD